MRKWTLFTAMALSLGLLAAAPVAAQQKDAGRPAKVRFAGGSAH